MKNQTSSWKSRNQILTIIDLWAKTYKIILNFNFKAYLNFYLQNSDNSNILSCPVLAWPVLFRPNLACPVLAWPVLSWLGLSCSVLTWPVLFRPNLTCPVQSCPIPTYPVRSCPILSYPILSYSVLFCNILSYSVLFCPILSYSVLSCPVSSFPVLACPTTVLVYLIEICRGPDEALVEGLRGSDQPGHLGTAGKLTIYKHLHTQNNRFGQKLEDRNQISKISQIQIFLGPHMTQKVYWWYY